MTDDRPMASSRIRKPKGYWLRVCPFCGTVPVMMPYHRSVPRKRMIECKNIDCPVQPFVIGTIGKQAADRWNTRYEDPADSCLVEVTNG